MRLRIETLSVRQIHDLVDAGLIPFALCRQCGPTPVSVNCYDEKWVAACPGCDLPVPASTLNWRDQDGAKEAGWAVDTGSSVGDIVFGDRRKGVVH